jgi:hypothetical protein
MPTLDSCWYQGPPLRRAAGIGGLFLGMAEGHALIQNLIGSELSLSRLRRLFWGQAQSLMPNA